MTGNGWKLSVTLLMVTAAAIGAGAQTFQSLFSFNRTDGAMPFAPLAQGRDGNLYGTTWGGGTGGAGERYGTVFRITPTGTFTTIYNFCSQNACADGTNPVGGLTLGSDGNFYGTTGSGGPLAGTVFKITPDGALTTLHTFGLTDDGEGPAGTLIQGLDGSFYGTTVGGGAYMYGTVFKITAEGAFTSLYSFDGLEAANPAAGLTLGTDGQFYGTTESGGNYGDGAVFRISPKGRLTILTVLHGFDGSQPHGTLLLANDGDLYGTAFYGGNLNCNAPLGCGTVFRVTSRGILKSLHRFNGSNGSLPMAGLIQATDGNLYGVTELGGSSSNCSQGCGTILSINNENTLTTLYNFDLVGGYQPLGNLLQSTNGHLYGTTGSGGSLDDGTVFMLDIGLTPFVAFVRNAGRIGESGGILGQGFTGTTDVSLHGTSAQFKVVSDTYIRATVPPGATTGYVTVTTPTGILKSNVQFHVIP